MDAEGLKESFGCSQSLNTPTCPTSPLSANMSRVNLNEEVKEDIFTGSYLLECNESPLLPRSRKCSVPRRIANFQDLRLQMNMCGKKTQESKEPALNLELNRFEGMRRRTGKLFGPKPNKETYLQSLPVLELFLIVPFEQLGVTIANVLEWFEKCSFSGEVRVQANHVAPGKKQERVLIAKILEPSFGMVIKLKRMLSLMNFEEVKKLKRVGIDVSHLLRWFDRYPVRVEIKGSSRPLVAKRIWITSNLDPQRWYPELDPDTYAALLRRLYITEFP